MQPILYLSSNPDNVISFIADQKKTFQTSSFTTFEILPSPSIGIEEVREIKKKLRFKSYQKIINLIIIYDIHKATTEAQNALLKLLEEPPSDTLFILTSSNAELILPTVVSRCRIIKDAFRQKEAPIDDKTIALLREILQSSPGARLHISQKFSGKKEDCLKFLDSLLPIMKNMLLHAHPEIKLTAAQLGVIITKILSARSYLEKNINSKAALDILFLSFPKI